MRLITKGEFERECSDVGFNTLTVGQIVFLSGVDEPGAYTVEWLRKGQNPLVELEYVDLDDDTDCTNSSMDLWD